VRNIDPFCNRGNQHPHNTGTYHTSATFLCCKLDLEQALMLAQVLELAQELVRQECCSSTELCTVVGHQD